MLLLIDLCVELLVWMSVSWCIPEVMSVMNSDSTHIPDITVLPDTACQKHGVIDGQVQMIKRCLKARSTLSRCLKCNKNVVMCQTEIMDIVILGAF